VDTRAEFLAEVVRMGEMLVPRLAAIPTASPVGVGGAPT
jgi:hypothetical protein